MKVPEKILKILEERGINFYILEMKEACNKFNILVKEDKKVAAALHLTC